MADILGPNPSMDDIDDAIMLRTVQLDTLQPDDLDFESEKRVIEQELESLYELQRGLQNAPSSPAAPTSFATSRPPTFSDFGLLPGASKSNTTPRAQRIAPINTFDRLAPINFSPASTHTSTRTNMSGKRNFDAIGSQYDGLSVERGSKRPSPAPSHPATPESTDDLAEADRQMRSLHDSSRVDAFKARAAARLKEREAMFAQQKKDEQLARSLENGQPSRPVSTQGGSSQAVFNSNGSLRRVSSSKAGPSTAGSNASPFTYTQAGPSTQVPYSFVKAEPSTVAPGYGGSHINTETSTFYPNNLQYPREPATPDSDDSDIQFGSAEEFQAASAGRAPRPSMPGGFPAPATAPQYPAYNPYASSAMPQPMTAPGYQGYQGYQTYAQAQSQPQQQQPGMQISQKLQDAMRKGYDALRNNPVAGNAYTALQKNLNQIHHMIGNTANPFDPASASQYNGLGYNINPNRPGPSSTPYNPRDLFQIDDDDDLLAGSVWNNVHLNQAEQQAELDKLLQNIHHVDDSDPALREPTPEALKEELYPHQRIGLAWMKRMEEGSNRGGILADDMGLGKTIQALSLIVSRPSQNPRTKTTLIIAPVALMRQWASEIKTKLKPQAKYQMSVYVHHGQKKKASFSELKNYDVVLTTFGSLASELRKFDKWKEIKARDQNVIPTARERTVLIGDGPDWYRVIIDEAQCIKNRATLSSKAASALKAKYRWCMTGTPMMNGIEDLYAQIRFLHIGPFDDWQRYRARFINTLTKSSNEFRREKAMKEFQTLLKAILLRRTKTSQIDGKPILQLPERIIEIEHAVFSDDEMDFYKALEQKTQITVNRYLREGTVMRNYANVLVLLLRLRQACCHPHLIKDYAQAVNMEGIPEEQRIALAKQLSAATIERIIHMNGEFECPVCYDATENPALMIPCGHDTCTECFSKITDPAAAIANGDEDGNTGAKCPQCREKADSNKVIDYNTFMKVHEPAKWAEKYPEEVDEERASDIEDEDGDSNSDTDSETADDESETESLGGFVVADDVETDDDDDLDRKPRPRKKKAAAQEKEKKPKKAKKSKQARGKSKKENVTLGELRKLAQRNKASKQRYLRRLRREWITSAKIEKTLQILHDTELADPTEKTIIFSQFTSLLDLLEVPIDDMGIKYERYDGSMKAGMRADAVHEFMNNPRCKVILVSLKAGNAGLNLTAASSVIIMDPFWNPFVEEQAIDRAHRIGQRREVKVHRMLIKETVEDRIVELQEKKRAIIGTALDENASRDLGRLNVGQIRYLFGLGGNADGTANAQG